MGKAMRRPFDGGPAILPNTCMHLLKSVLAVTSPRTGMVATLFRAATAGVGIYCYLQWSTFRRTRKQAR